MITGIKQRAIVGKSGKIEIPNSELPEGTTVEIIVLVEELSESPLTTELGSSEVDLSDAETAYLLSTQANRVKLLESLENAKDPKNLVVITPEEWHEKYSV